MELKFKEFLLETANEAEWRRLLDHINTQFKSGPFKANGVNWHNALMNAMKAVGLNTSEFELYAPTQDDIQFGQTPSYGMGMTMGDVLKHKGNEGNREKFNASYRAYMGLLDNLADYVWSQGQQRFGWRE